MTWLRGCAGSMAKWAVPQIFSYGPAAPNALPLSTSIRDLTSTRTSSAKLEAGPPRSSSPTPNTTAAMCLEDCIVHSHHRIATTGNAARSKVP